MEKNTFGGGWTIAKIDIFMKYVNAYLNIMKKYPNFKLIYFDGFAGCGTIDNNENETIAESVALKVLGLANPKKFDFYYLVELNEKKALTLEAHLKKKFPKHKHIHVVGEDCNDKLISMAEFLESNKEYRALAFIDPFGMQLSWSSIEACKDLGIDFWVLVPTGVGANRLLKKNGQISDAWTARLESFFGLDINFIKSRFYTTQATYNLFGEQETREHKAEKVIQKIADLYRERLKEVWNHVSKPYPMMSKGKILYHFILATNSKVGLKIGNDIIGKKITKG